MAAYTSASSGNWSAGSTWVGGVAPPTGAGHTVTIANTHVVTVDQNWTIGASLASPSTAIAVTGPTGKLILGMGVTLIARGDIILTNAPFTMNAGSVLEFDASAATLPLNQHYVLQTATAGAQYNTVLTVTGTAGARCTIRSNVGGGTGSLRMNGAGSYTAYMTFRYTDFTNLGTATVVSIEKGGLTSTFDLEQCVFDGCGQILAGGSMDATAIFRLVNVTMKNTLHANTGFTGDSSAAALTSGTRLIQGCVFDKAVSSAFRDYTITDSVMMGGGTSTPPLVVVGTSPWASCTGNLLEWPVGADCTILGNLANSYCLANHVTTNPHFLMGKATLTISGCVFEYSGTANNGDCVSAFAVTAPSTVTVEHCLGLPNGGSGTSGTAMSMLGGANFTGSVRHNTWAVGGQAAVNVGETYAGHAGLLAEFRDNLVWDVSATPTTYKLQGIAPVSNVVLSANCHHNAGYHLLAGSNLKGYHNLTFSSGVPGANDVDGTNPDFVDATRNIKTWDASIAGGAGSVANALTELKKKNEAGYNPAYTIAALLAWVKAGFIPRAPALQAASDSVAPSTGWIGALQGTGSGADPSRLLLLGVGA